jgi:hypothetical protein
MNIRDEVVKELIRRGNLIAEHATKGDIATGMSGSMIRFRMALAPIGSASTPPDWMTEKETKPCMTQEEFDNDVYEKHMRLIFEQTLKTVYSK